MAKESKERIHASRQLMQNPYAYLDDQGLYSVLPKLNSAELQLLNKIIEERERSQNPYAFLDDLGGFSAIQEGALIQDNAYPRLRPKTHKGYPSLLEMAKKRSRHSDIEIENMVTDLQTRMWLDRNQIWCGMAPSNPIDILDPAIALGLIGYDYDLSETLGQYVSDGKQVEIAGIIDESSKLVRISRQFPSNVRNFTTAHELGHALLHNAQGLHRDRPLDRAGIDRGPIEFEADRFATYFLMPKKLVLKHFKQRFVKDKFTLNEDSMFALMRGNSFDSENDFCTLRDLSRIIANVESYNGRHFMSLAKEFRVSVEAMAIRLEELNLLAI